MRNWFLAKNWPWKPSFRIPDWSFLCVLGKVQGLSWGWRQHEYQTAIFVSGQRGLKQLYDQLLNVGKLGHHAVKLKFSHVLQWSSVEGEALSQALRCPCHTLECPALIPAAVVPAFQLLAERPRRGWRLPWLGSCCPHVRPTSRSLPLAWWAFGKGTSGYELFLSLHLSWVLTCKKKNAEFSWIIISESVANEKMLSK